MENRRSDRKVLIGRKETGIHKMWGKVFEIEVSGLTTTKASLQDILDLSANPTLRIISGKHKLTFEGLLKYPEIQERIKKLQGQKGAIPKRTGFSPVPVPEITLTEDPAWGGIRDKVFAPMNRLIDQLSTKGSTEDMQWEQSEPDLGGGVEEQGNNAEY